MGAYHFRLLLVSLGSTYAQSISSKAILKLVTFPRKFNNKEKKEIFKRIVVLMK